MLVPDSFTVRGVDGKIQEHILTADTTMAGARAIMVRKFGIQCAYAVHIPVASMTVGCGSTMQLLEQARADAVAS